MRYLKTLGLTFAAVLIAAALAVPGAHAEQSYQATSSTSLTGTQVATNSFHIPGAGTVECSGASFSETFFSVKTSTLAISPSYTGCVAFGFASTDFSTNFCNFELTTPASFKAAVDLYCLAGGKMKITPTFFGVSVCTVEIGSQTPSGSVDLANKSENGFAESQLLLTWTLTKIAHTAGCGAAAASDGEYTGSVTLKAVLDRLWVT